MSNSDSDDASFSISESSSQTPTPRDNAQPPAGRRLGSNKNITSNNKKTTASSGRSGAQPSSHIQGEEEEDESFAIDGDSFALDGDSFALEEETSTGSGSSASSNARQPKAAPTGTTQRETRRGLPASRETTVAPLAGLPEHSGVHADNNNTRQKKQEKQARPPWEDDPDETTPAAEGRGGAVKEEQAATQEQQPAAKEEKSPKKEKKSKKEKKPKSQRPPWEEDPDETTPPVDEGRSKEEQTTPTAPSPYASTQEQQQQQQQRKPKGQSAMARPPWEEDPKETTLPFEETSSKEEQGTTAPTTTTGATQEQQPTAKEEKSPKKEKKSKKEKKPKGQSATVPPPWEEDPKETTLPFEEASRKEEPETAASPTPTGSTQQEEPQHSEPVAEKEKSPSPEYEEQQPRNDKEEARPQLLPHPPPRSNNDNGAQAGKEEDEDQLAKSSASSQGSVDRPPPGHSTYSRTSGTTTPQSPLVGDENDGAVANHAHQMRVTPVRQDRRPNWMFKPQPESSQARSESSVEPMTTGSPQSKEKKDKSPSKAKSKEPGNNDDDDSTTGSRTPRSPSDAGSASSKSTTSSATTAATTAAESQAESAYYDEQGHPHSRDDTVEAQIAQNVEKRNAMHKTLLKMQPHDRVEVAKSTRSIYTQPVFGACRRFRQRELAPEYHERVAQDASAARHRQQMREILIQNRVMEEQKKRDAGRIKETNPRLMRRLPHQQKKLDELVEAKAKPAAAAASEGGGEAPRKEELVPMQPRRPGSARPASAKVRCEKLYQQAETKRQRPQTAAAGGRAAADGKKEPKPIPDAKFQDRFFTQQVKHHQQVEKKLHKKYVIDRDKENKELAFQHPGVKRKKANKPKEKLDYDDVMVQVEQLAVHDVERRQKNHEKHVNKALNRTPWPPGCYVEGCVVTTDEYEEFQKPRDPSEIAARMHDASVQHSEKIRDSLVSKEEKAFQGRQVHNGADPVTQEKVNALADRLSQYHVRDFDAAAKEEEQRRLAVQKRALSPRQQQELGERLSTYNVREFPPDQPSATRSGRSSSKRPESAPGARVG